MFTTLVQQDHAQQPQFVPPAISAMHRSDVLGIQTVLKDEEAFACWEDSLDLLGSEPNLIKLRELLDEAPCIEHELYAFALNHYRERLPAAMQDWEDTLDSMGIWCDLQELEIMLANCPDPDHPTALFLAGVITQRLLAG